MPKKDIFSSLAIGELCSWFIVIIIQNLKLAIPFWWLLPIVFPLLCLAGLLAAYFLAKKFPLFYQVAQFVLVGGLNTLIDIGILNLLILIFGIATGFFFSIFKAISFAVAVTNSYFWNKFWTFQHKEKTGVEEISRFLGISLAGFAINVAVATLVVNIIGPQFGLNQKIWANIGAALAAIAGMTWNFVGYKLVVFK